MRCVLVSHTHWDREWYRTFESFRARLVDTVDRVLELVAGDAGYHFQLDGQTIVVEDYLAVRPEKREALVEAVRAGRVALGPWYVQPDSLIPTGETHVRNLLEGRRVAEQHGGCSTIAYTPDSFGHPDQFPQLLRGFGLGPFVYWRGNGDEIDDLPSDYRWQSPDGSEVVACHLAKGYFSAWGIEDDVEVAAARLEGLARSLAKRSRRERVLLMNGLDHMLPDANTREAAEALAKATGWEVVRGLLDDYVDDLGPTHGSELDDALPVFAGELVGGRLANLLPGVWSTHVDLKLANRRCEVALVSRAEPLAALARWLGGPDERASLRVAWRTLLPNQAHDSICGCSQDRVHEQMTTRLDTTLELAEETSARLLERLTGLPTDRQQAPPAEPDGPIELAVFNPSPRTRTERLAIPLTGFPPYTRRGVSPLLQINQGLEGVTVDGAPARLVVDHGTERPMLTPAAPVHTVHAVVKDVPAFGWRRVEVRRAPPCPDDVDDGRTIAAGAVRVTADDSGLLEVRIGHRQWTGLCALEDTGDRGDTYDYDPVGEGPGPRTATATATATRTENAEVETISVEITRRRHASGLQALTVARVLSVPVGLNDDRTARQGETVELPVTLTAEVVPGTDRVDLHVRVVNTARDHRLRLVCPTGRRVATFEAGTTFGRATRRTAPPDASRWIHPAPTTFPMQGFVEVEGLGVLAPGLLEAEVSPEGRIALTLLRSVGWLSRPDLTTRPGEAGPSLPTPGAQCLGEHAYRLSLYATDPADATRDAHRAEVGLVAGLAGPRPLLPEAQSLLAFGPGSLVLSALKPAEDGPAVILRISNPTEVPERATLRLAAPLSSRVDRVDAASLDECPLSEGAADGFALQFDRDAQGGTLAFDVPPHALRTLRLGLLANDRVAS